MTNTTTTTTAHAPASAGGHEALIQRLVEAIETYFQTGDASGFDEVLAADSVNHVPGMPADREGLKQALGAFRAAFPDLKITVEEVISQGDRVVDRLTWTATHQGPLMGIPASGKRVTVGEVHVARVKDGKFVERWGQWDALGLMQQIGAVPGPQGQ